MSRGFWDKLKKPIFALAPMANVTDAAFRSIIAAYGKPDVTWTEFVSVDGLLSAGREKLLVDLRYSEAERPIVAQIFGSKPEKFFEVAKMLAEMQFDGIDINMGCPVKKVLNQQSCSALIKTPTVAQEIIQATQEGARELPVSVKTRLGFYKTGEWEQWLPKILEMNPAVLTVHLRTVKEMSKVAAHWELMPEIVKMVKSYKAVPRESSNGNHAQLRPTPYDAPFILGNGDVSSIAEAQEKVVQTGCDGVMIGRGIFGNPWLFNPARQMIPIPERMKAMLEHAKLFEQEFKGIKNFEVMKKHFKAYVNNFDGAKELRLKLMEAENYPEVEKIVFEHYPILKQDMILA